MSRKLLAALLLLPATALAQTALENGIAVAVPPTGAGTPQDPRTYTLDVPNGTDELRVIMTGGQGDADLYVNFGTPWFGGTDTDPAPDCVQDGPTTEESCTILSPPPGIWYIQVDAATNFGNDINGNSVELVAVAAVELADGVNETIAGAGGEAAWYFIEVPASQGHLTVATSGGTGNPDIFVGADLFAGPDCTSQSGTTVDDCSIDQPAAGTWFVQIAGVATYSGVTLNAEFGPERAPSAGSVGGGPMPPLTLCGLLLGALAAAGRRRRARPA